MLSFMSSDMKRIGKSYRNFLFCMTKVDAAIEVVKVLLEEEPYTRHMMSDVIPSIVGTIARGRSTQC